MWGRLSSLLQCPRIGYSSYRRTMMTKIIMISLVARKRPGHTDAPPPNALYAELFAPSFLFCKNRRGSKILGEVPHTEELVCNSAEGIKSMESCFRRYLSSIRVSFRITRPDALVECTRRVSWTTDDRRVQLATISAILTWYLQDPTSSSNVPTCGATVARTSFRRDG